MKTIIVKLSRENFHLLGMQICEFSIEPLLLIVVTFGVRGLQLPGPQIDESSIKALLLIVLNDRSFGHNLFQLQFGEFSFDLRFTLLEHREGRYRLRYTLWPLIHVAIKALDDVKEQNTFKFHIHVHVSPRRAA